MITKTLNLQFDLTGNVLDVRSEVDEVSFSINFEKLMYISKEKTKLSFVLSDGRTKQLCASLPVRVIDELYASISEYWNAWLSTMAISSSEIQPSMANERVKPVRAASVKHIRVADPVPTERSLFGPHRLYKDAAGNYPRPVVDYTKPTPPDVLTVFYAQQELLHAIMHGVKVIRALARCDVLNAKTNMVPTFSVWALSDVFTPTHLGAASTLKSASELAEAVSASAELVDVQTLQVVILKDVDVDKISALPNSYALIKTMYLR